MGAGFPHALQNVDDLYCRQLTRGDRFAIAAAELAGSWRFILWQSVFFVVYRLTMKEDFETARRVEQEVRAVREALAQHTELFAALLEAPESRARR